MPTQERERTGFKKWQDGMQIGVRGDPGLASFLSGKEGGDLIVTPAWKGRLTMQSARAMPTHNIRAGIGYLLMRMAIFEFRSMACADSRVYETTVKAGDSFDKIGKMQGTTIDNLKKLNPHVVMLRPGQILKYQKASHQRVITGWRVISTASIANRYNGGGDPNYVKKLDVALTLARNGSVALCAP
ncbi:LysM peptidoglycan-binding domain-containing protein [Cupriavidus campinensis]